MIRIPGFALIAFSFGTASAGDVSQRRAWAHRLGNTNEAGIGKPISGEELVRRTGSKFLPIQTASFVQVIDQNTAGMA